MCRPAVAAGLIPDRVGARPLVLGGSPAAGLRRGEPRVRDRCSTLDVLLLGAGAAIVGVLVPVDVLAPTLRDGAQETEVAIAHVIGSDGLRSATASASAMTCTSGASVASR